MKYKLFQEGRKRQSNDLLFKLECVETNGKNEINLNTVDEEGSTIFYILSITEKGVILHSGLDLAGVPVDGESIIKTIRD